MKRIALALMWALLLPAILAGQTPTPAPAPTTSTASFSIGASALGLGAGNANAAAASDVILNLQNPAGAKSTFWQGFSLRSDNLLSPGSNTQYYGGGVQAALPLKLKGTLAPLTFYVDGTAGIGRIVPATAPSSAHPAFMAGGGVKWLTSSGVQISLIEVNALHVPGAPWGATTPAVSGGISYLWGKQ